MCVGGGRTGGRRAGGFSIAKLLAAVKRFTEAVVQERKILTTYEDLRWKTGKGKKSTASQTILEGRNPAPPVETREFWYDIS